MAITGLILSILAMIWGPVFYFLILASLAGAAGGGRPRTKVPNGASLARVLGDLHQEDATDQLDPGLQVLAFRRLRISSLARVSRPRYLISAVNAEPTTTAMTTSVAMQNTPSPKKIRAT
jgi:hypothetical protein